MSLRTIGVADFRCLEAVELELDDHCNIVVGANGSGKTSLLEAVAYLSRGRSFRGTRVDALVRHGCKHFRILGNVGVAGREHRLGVEGGRGHAVMRLDRAPAGGFAALAEKLAVQVIDPEVHRLVGDGPEVRRRFLDYGVFHVKQEFLPAWRRYRRALRQRNAVLAQGAAKRSLEPWDTELLNAGSAVDALRSLHAAELSTEFCQVGGSLLDAELSCVYRPGWAEGTSFVEALALAGKRDREQGMTTVGPHRAELRLHYRGRAARQQVSRGQQKLYGAALVLAQTRLLRRYRQDPPVLLVDDPAAELDGEALARLLAVIGESESQLIITALSPETLSMPQHGRMFHVEHGRVLGGGEP